ncbi:mucin-5AC isoform X2 [Anopheles arabiensis]|uniref:Nuclear protein MDM1 n=1 Tax=Anopheles arabiensis TaxID=7173 RepID=A0A182I865_ANOAR|nr:mucin-5AC isoform X2 [Anopheles arabiensis]
MIGSFWNLCRACPSMPVDKLHSEYRSTYRWHEYTGGPDVVRKPPVPNQFASSKADHFFSKSTEDEKFIEASINEPPLPRRKKCPELAYRTNEFLAARGKNEAIGHDRTDAGATTHTRARSEERGTPSRRSKSEGPPAGVANGRLPTGTGYANGTIEPPPAASAGRALEQAGESSTSGLFKKTITKLSTEYRLQFVWPHVRRAIRAAGAHGAAGDGDGADTVDAPPRKSLSMGALKAAQIGAAGGGTIASVHKKRTTNEREATATELEPLVNDCDTSVEKPQQPNEKRGEMARVVEQKIKALRVEKEKFGFEPEAGDVSRAQANSGIDNAWYKEVLELRKKAGEYRNRGWGVEMNPDLFTKQVELWDQVSRRSSLSALSLASSVRPITKEEKDKENNKKSSPTKPRGGRVPGGARPVEANRAALPDGLNFSAAARSRKDAIRHHLERTTGPDVEEGALLPSPTREKLMPAIPRSKADSPQRGSPQKTALSRHGSPQKGSPQKSSPKKMSSKGRSQSVGPAVATDGTAPVVAGGSPKRQIRSGSTVAASTASSAAKTHKKTPTTATAPVIAQNQQLGPQQPERRPRPTSLSTTNHSRSKSSTLPTSRLHAPHSSTLTNLTNNNHLPNASPSSSAATMAASMIASTTSSSMPANAATAAARAKLTLATASTKRQPGGARSVKPPTSLASDSSAPSSASSTLRKKQRVATVPEGGGGTVGGRGSGSARSVESDKKLPTGSVEDADKESAPTVVPPPEILEQIIKSPPEPTRVKSPEQIIMRSPDPVNWTVPLDTGKTFTVTQNVREGDPMIRPHSEIKASTPVEQPPPPPQSAPPELSEQSKMPNTKLEPSSIKESEDEDDDLPRSKSSVASSVNPTSMAISEPMTVSQPPPPSSQPTAALVKDDAKDDGPAGSGGTQPTVGTATASAPEPVRYDKPVAGSTLRCLEDPSFESDINSPLANRNVATEVLDKARDRFDRFWGNPNEKPEES